MQTPELAIPSGLPVHSGLRIAIGQIRMHWSIEGNLAEMLDAMALASREGAQLCLFPELTLPGFHREIVSLAKPDLIGEAIDVLRAECARLALVIAFGAPSFDGSLIRNTCFLLGRNGETLATIHKNGLTGAEASFFAAGVDRPVVSCCGLASSVIVCREIEDADVIWRQLGAEGVELLLWPGQMRPDPARPASDPPAHVLQAQMLARRLGAHLIQANWPNALNRPSESAEAGHSAVIAADGSLLFRVPKAQAGVAVFNLGEREFSWFGSGVARSLGSGRCRVAEP